MARERIFSRETRLYHPLGGWTTFPPGESDPGPAWSETDSAAPEPGTRDAATLKEMADLTLRAEKAEATVASRGHDFARLEQAAADSLREAATQKTRADVAEKAAAEAEADKLRMAGERDHAREAEGALRNEIAALKNASAGAGEKVERLMAELEVANQKAADALDKVRAKEEHIQLLETDLANAKAKIAPLDGDGDGSPGGAKKKSGGL